VTQNLPYGRGEALIFLNELMPAAPDVVVQVAHLAGAGPWQDEGSQQAFAVFADAVERRDPRTRLLYFDITTLGAPATPDTAQRWAAMIRQVGIARIVFGSDATVSNVTPGDAWAMLRKLLPLTENEFRAIAANVPPYMQ
jgi:predicted TIM-barrel fold metal-dependent hydrolase